MRWIALAFVLAACGSQPERIVVEKPAKPELQNPPPTDEDFNIVRGGDCPPKYGCVPREHLPIILETIDYAHEAWVRCGTQVEEENP